MDGRFGADPTPRPPGDLRLAWRAGRVTRPLLIDGDQAAVFKEWLSILNEADVPYAVGGAYAVYGFTGVWRDTKDLDAFLRPEDVKRAVDAFRRAGFQTEIRDRLWLAKVHHHPYLLDLLFAGRHTRRLKVSDQWFRSCVPAEFLGVPTCVLAPEEVIVTKAYLGGRDRFDGADILHLIHAVKGRLDWRHVIDLLGGDEEIVLWHLLLFQFVYPGRTDYLPTDLMERAFERLKRDWRRSDDGSAFRGLLLDPESFAVDVEEWGYDDTRERTPLVDCEGSVL